MKPSAPLLSIGVPLIAVPLWFATGQLGLSKLHPSDKSLTGLEYTFLNDFVFSLCLLAFVGGITLRATLRPEASRLEFLIGCVAGMAILLFFHTLTLRVTNASQFREIANSMRMIFVTPLAGYICWRARHALAGDSRRSAAGVSGAATNGT